jgi:hypothetical protein
MKNGTIIFWHEREKIAYLLFLLPRAPSLAVGDADTARTGPPKKMSRKKPKMQKTIQMPMAIR